MRELLFSSPVPRTFLQGEPSGDLSGRAGLEAAGVSVVMVPGAGHTIMFDNAYAFVEAIARNRSSVSV